MHSVEISEIYSHTILHKKFVKVMLLLKKLLNSWFDEFFQWEHSNTVWKSRKFIYSHAFLAKLSWMQRVDLTEKCFGESKLFIFPQCGEENFSYTIF